MKSQDHSFLTKVFNSCEGFVRIGSHNERSQ